MNGFDLILVLGRGSTSNLLSSLRGFTDDDARVDSLDDDGAHIDPDKSIDPDDNDDSNDNDDDDDDGGALVDVDESIGIDDDDDAGPV